jgi:hypothetical protein
MAIVLNTPIVLSNIHRWNVIDYTPHKYTSPEYAEVLIQVLCADGTEYGRYSLVAKDAGNCTTLGKNAHSTGFGDKLATGSSDLPGAYTAINAADEGASGGKTAHLNAIALACMATGLMSADLAGS